MQLTAVGRTKTGQTVMYASAKELQVRPRQVLGQTNCIIVANFNPAVCPVRRQHQSVRSSVWSCVGVGDFAA